jgi:hypothetical protein
LTGNRWIEATQLISSGNLGFIDPASAGLAWQNWADGMAIMRELGDAWGLAMGYNIAGNVALRSGDLTLAKSSYEQSAALFEAESYLQMANISRSGLAEIARLQGDYGRAQALYPAVMRVWRLIDQRGGIARCLECLGFIAQAQASEVAKPLALLRRAATLYGAADAIRRANNAPMTPWEKPEYERYVAALRSLLAPDEFEHAWQAGQSLDLDRAVALATTAV